MSGIEFKNALKIPFINFKFLLIIILLSVITIIGPKSSLIALTLSIFLTFGLIGTNIISTLKNYDLKTILKILELSTIYFVSSLIYLIFYSIIIGILFIPIYFLRNNVDIGNVFSFNSTLIIIILIVMVMFFCILILESLKNIGFIRHLKSKKFEDIFDFKKNIKIIYTKNFFSGILFLCGYFVFLFVLFILILSIVSLILKVLSDKAIGILIVFLFYLFSSAMLITFNEIYKAYK